MLILAKKIGEVLTLGEKKAVVLDIEEDRIMLSIDGSPGIIIYDQDCINIADGTGISAKKVNDGQFELDFIAPGAEVVNMEKTKTEATIPTHPSLVKEKNTSIPLFKNIKIRIKKNAFAKTALLETNKWLSYLLTSDEACKEYRCIRIIKERGKESVQEYREHIIKKVSTIVQSENPITAMCKELIANVKSECVNRLVWTEEFHSHRHLIYDALNKNVVDIDDYFTDETTAFAMFWCEAESLCLRYLQTKMFDDTSEVDW